MVPRARLCVGAARPEKPGSRWALAARSHAQARSAGRGDPRGAFPWLSHSQPRPARAAPPLPVPLRSVGAQLPPGAAGGGIAEMRAHDPSRKPRMKRGAYDSAGAAWGPPTCGASAQPKLEEPVTYLMSSHTSRP